MVFWENYDYVWAFENAFIHELGGNSLEFVQFGVSPNTYGFEITYCGTGNVECIINIYFDELIDDMKNNIDICQYLEDKILRGIDSYYYDDNLVNDISNFVSNVKKRIYLSIVYMLLSKKLMLS